MVIYNAKNSNITPVQSLFTYDVGFHYAFFFFYSFVFILCNDFLRVLM